MLGESETNDKLEEMTVRTVNALRTVDKDPRVVFLGVTCAAYFHIDMLLDKGRHEDAARFVEGLRLVIKEYEWRMNA